MGHLRACAREALAAGLYYFVSIYYHATPVNARETPT